MEYGEEPSDSADAISLLQAHQRDEVCIGWINKYLVLMY